MAIGLRLLKLTAKIALDRLIGGRTDEAISLLDDWWSGGDAAARDRELAEAKAAASDAVQLGQVVAETIKAESESVDASKTEALALSLSLGFKALPDHLGTDPSGAKTIVEQILPGKAKTFLVWLDHPVFAGPRRYVHFNWTGESWRVRDFVGGKIFHPPGAKATDKGLMATEAPVSAVEVWNASRGQVQCLNEYGLNFAVTEREDWQKILSLLSRAAEEW